MLTETILFFKKSFLASLVKFLKSNIYFNRPIEFQRASMWKTSPVEEHGVPVTRKNLHHHSRLLEVSIFLLFFFCIFSPNQLSKIGGNAWIFWIWYMRSIFEKMYRNSFSIYTADNIDIANGFSIHYEEKIKIIKD